MEGHGSLGFNSELMPRYLPNAHSAHEIIWRSKKRCRWCHPDWKAFEESAKEKKSYIAASFSNVDSSFRLNTWWSCFFLSKSRPSFPAPVWGLLASQEHSKSESFGHVHVAQNYPVTQNTPVCRFGKVGKMQTQTLTDHQRRLLFTFHWLFDLRGNNGLLIFLSLGKIPQFPPSDHWKMGGGCYPKKPKKSMTLPNIEVHETLPGKTRVSFRFLSKSSTLQTKQPLCEAPKTKNGRNPLLYALPNFLSLGSKLPDLQIKRGQLADFGSKRCHPNGDHRWRSGLCFLLPNRVFGVPGIFDP